MVLSLHQTAWPPSPRRPDPCAPGRSKLMPGPRNLKPWSLHRRAVRPDPARRGRLWPRVEELEAHVLLSTFVVNTPVDDTVPGNGLLSLREAITAANAAPGSTIDFALPDPTVPIQPTSELP